MTIKEGQPAPDFTAPATSDTTITLSALKGKKVVLYFYPKDSTPGCTTEGQNFRDLYPNQLVWLDRAWLVTQDRLHRSSRAV